MVELDKVDPEYQEITFNEVSETFSQEELEGKDLILIRAPADVNIFFVLIKHFYTFLHFSKIIRFPFERYDTCKCTEFINQ